MLLLAPLRLVARVGKRFRAERLAQTAAALAFTTMLGLVPMIIVAASLIDHLPFSSLGAAIGTALEKFLLANLLPDKAGTVVAKLVGQFTGRAERVTLIGGLALVVTALMQMLTIEHAFNAIWKIRAPRSLARRLTMHLLTLIFGPLLFGISLAVTTYLASASLGLVSEPQWVTTAVLGTLSFGFVAGLFGVLYWGVPNRPVASWHAGTGGLLAAIGFLGLQRLFGLYVVNFPTYTMVYGPFAALPIFLIWLYASWTVILLGALVTAELPRAAKP
jgi:membrane protein